MRLEVCLAYQELTAGIVSGTLLANPDVCEEMLSVVEKYGIRVHTKVSNSVGNIGAVTLTWSDMQSYPFEELDEMVKDYLGGETLGRLVMTFDSGNQADPDQAQAQVKA